MKQLTILVGLLFFLPCLLSLSISPNSINKEVYGGECNLVGLTITNPYETDLVAYLYYTTDLEDTIGLTIKAENPFIAKKGLTEIPLQICTVPNFAPGRIDLNIYADANIEQKIVIKEHSNRGGGGMNIIYKDKNIYVPTNTVVEVPKEIIKEVPTEIIVTKEVPVEKIITKEVLVENGFNGLSLIIIILCSIVVSLVIGLIIGYFMFKPHTEAN
jgi:hypothetical protein